MLAMGLLHTCNAVMFLSLLCSLPTFWLVTSLGVSLSPSFQMSVSGATGCFLGENNLHASVRALAEVACGWFETDSKDHISVSVDCLVFETKGGRRCLVS